MNTKQEKGLYNRFVVCRVDENGNPKAGHEDRQYFVLDIFNDPFAIDALRAYAKACSDSFPALANDLNSVALEAQIQRVENLLQEVQEKHANSQSA